ncbi:MAG: hypothetical protein ABFD25_04965 [Clostridiaceae bacterium]
MLGKLLKYEVKSTARLFVPLYLAVLVVAVINRLMKTMSALENVVSFNIKTITSLIITITFFILMAGIMVATLVVVIQRFYKNLLGDEGYLMFTLPVQQWKDIASKLLVSLLWYVFSIIVAISSICIYANFNILKYMPDMFKFINTYLGYAAYLEVPVLVLLLLAYTVIQIYAAITLGHLFSKHKLLASLGMYVILYTIGQIFASTLTVFFLKTIFLPLDQNTIPSPYYLNLFAVYAILLTTLLSAGYFAITNFILKNRLNLE